MPLLSSQYLNYLTIINSLCRGYTKVPPLSLIYNYTELTCVAFIFQEISPPELVKLKSVADDMG